MPIDRFLQVVAEFPSAMAIDTGDRCVSYAELSDLVHNLASHLDALNLPRQSTIGLLGIRQLSTYVGYLAIMRAGHVVVPLSPDHPLAFQKAVAEMANVACALIPGGQGQPLGAALATRACILDPAEGMRSLSQARINSGMRKSTDISYILFTSGSTGTPKGVPVSDLNVATYLDEVVDAYEVGVGARLSQTFALTFDPSVFDILGSFTTGATLVIPRNQELLAPASYVANRGITHWYSVPSLISYAARLGNLRPGVMSGLKWSNFIGEPLSLDLARKWHIAAPNSSVNNVYGPTELTISCAAYRLGDSALSWPQTPNGTVPIGTVYPQLEWILVRDGQLVEDDGELCIRGPQRFDGYLEPSRNAGRFFRVGGGEVRPLDYSDRLEPSDWYRTGDRVRRYGGPSLLHLGRIDRQVKVKGYRIELADVEAALRRHPSVIDSAVLTRANKSGVSELIAVISGPSTTNPDDAARPIMEHLRMTIPSYMIPASITVLDELPLSVSGKTDYAALQVMLSLSREA